MGVNTNKQRIVLQTDAIQGNEPSRLQVAAMTDKARRRLQEQRRLQQARIQYRQTHSRIPGIDTMSDEEIDRNIYLETKPVAQFRQDRKTTTQRRAGEEAFKRLEAEEEAKKRNQDVLDRGDAIMSVSTDYVPLLGSVLRAGQYNFARQNLGYDYASNRYGYTPLISSTIDVATIPLGVGTKQLAVSYAGGIGGRYVGNTYFDSPYAGQFIGTLLGGPVYNTVTNVASNANSAYKGFRLGREFNRGINNAQFFNTPVEHVSNNGVTIGSALDVGNEGIHLSPIGSSTTPRVEQFLLNQGQFPYVRRGIWTFTNNTAPVEVKDLGYFGKGFNKDFDTKVNEGFKNFVYSNNYEGKFGDKQNVSFLTMDPSHNLQLSKNTQNSEINWEEPISSISTNIFQLADGTLIPEYRSNLLSQYLGNPQSFRGKIFSNYPNMGIFDNIYKYQQNGRQYLLGIGPNNIAYATPETNGVKFIPFNANNYEEALSQAETTILNSRNSFIESFPDQTSKDIIRTQQLAPESLMFSIIPRKDPISRLEDTIRSRKITEAEEIYLSDEYIDRYMKSLGLNPNSIFREQIRQQLSNDLHTIEEDSSPTLFFNSNSDLGGSSQTIDAINNQFYLYGINSNADKSLLKDWPSVIFHEGGHNLWRSNTKMGNYIRNYDIELLKKYPLEYTNPKYAQEAKNPNTYAGYLSKPTEFRQRIMEGFRYGIKEGLTPREIYDECDVSGFIELKKFFNKEYLIKMLGLMLGTVPVMVNIDNDKTS